MTDPTPEQLAYIAGFLDGEGCFGLYKIMDGKHLQYRITASQADPVVLHWIQGLLGGKVRRNPLRVKRSPHLVHLWGMYQRHEVMALCNQLLPYLIVKRPQAQALLRYKPNEALIREMSRLKRVNYVRK